MDVGIWADSNAPETEAPRWDGTWQVPGRCKEQEGGNQQDSVRGGVWEVTEVLMSYGPAFVLYSE